MPPHCTCQPVSVTSSRGPFRYARAWLGYWLELARQARRSRRGLCAHFPLAPLGPRGTLRDAGSSVLPSGYVQGRIVTR